MADRRGTLLDAAAQTLALPCYAWLMIYFTADTHFGDAHILRHRASQFRSIADHDAALVERWNERVGPADTVWHLGDFAAGATPEHCAAMFAALNGTKRLVRGNHDSNRVLHLPWTEIVESARITIEDEGGTEWRLFLSHYAHRCWPGLWRGTRHLYGHTHGTIDDTQRSCDVGVDSWDYRPATLPELIRRQERAVLLPEELERYRQKSEG